MKSWFDYLKYILSGLFLVSMACSCTRNEDPKYNGETATLSLNIPMLQSSSRAGISGTPEEDAIHHLRVVILSQGAKESINKVFTKSQIEASKGNITIDNVPVGDVQMYVIANETSIGKDYTELTTLQNDIIQVNGSGKRKVLVKDNERKHFPKRGSEFDNENSNLETTKGLPMSWMKQFTVNPPAQESQYVNVELQRCVAKLNIIMQSTLSESIIINKMSFGKFFGNKLYLFQETNLDVPDKGDNVDLNNQYVGKEYTGLNIEIPKDGVKTLVCYIYPSFAWTDKDKPSPYTIGFTTDKTTYEPKYFIDKNGILNSIARNTQVNITAKLSKPANIDITFEVVPWDSQTVDVPSFN